MERDPALIKKLESELKKPPFNCGFGMYLYLMRNDVQGIFPQRDQILKDIEKVGMRDFDVYRLTENLTPELIKEIENEHFKVAEKFRPSYIKFINSFKKHYDKRNKLE